MRLNTTQRGQSLKGAPRLEESVTWRLETVIGKNEFLFFGYTFPSSSIPEPWIHEHRRIRMINKLVRVALNIILAKYFYR